jgi:hypothetical protein
VFGAERNEVSGGYKFFSGPSSGGTAGAGAGASGEAADGAAPRQLKTIMNLSTQITSSCYHPSGQILAIASNQVSCSMLALTTVFISNFFFFL